MYVSQLISSIPAASNKITFGILRIGIAAVVLFAAAMKSYALSMAGSESFASFHLPLYVVKAGVAVEYVLGSWLLLGVFSTSAWAATLVIFIIFSIMAQFAAISGDRICSCFGFFSTSPWFTSFMDLSIVFALIMIRPEQKLFPNADQPHTPGRLNSSLKLCSAALLLTATSLVLFSGIAAQLHAFSGPQQSKTDHPSDDASNSAILVTSLGGTARNPDSPTAPVASIESLEQIHRCGQSASGCLERVEALTALDMRANSGSDPVILEDKSGQLIFVLGTVTDVGESYYQILSGNRPPFMMAKSQLNPALIAHAWRAKHSQQTGVTLEVGRMLLNFDRLYHNFGIVRPNDAITTEFKIVNAGERPIAFVGKPITSCGCTTAQIEDGNRLEPSASTKLAVRVLTSNRNIRYTVKLVVEDSGSKDQMPITLEVMGTQIASMAIVPATLDFGAAGLGKQVNRMLRITESASDRFKINSVDIGNLPLRYSLSSKENADGLKNYIFEFTLSLTTRPASEKLEFVTVHTDSRLLPDVQIPVTYRVHADIQLSPKVVAFGTLAINASTQRIIKLSGPQIGDKCKVQFNNLPDSVTAVVESMRDGICEIRVSLCAKTSGPTLGSFSIVLDTPQGHRTFPVEFSGFAVVTSELSSRL